MAMLKYTEIKKIIDLEWSLINEGLLEIQQVSREQLQDALNWQKGDFILVDSDMFLNRVILCKFMEFVIEGIHVMVKVETRQEYSMLVWLSQCMRISKSDAKKQGHLLVW